MTPPRLSDLPALGIRRPWLVLVLNLLIAIAGIAALMGVEVRELPDVDRPVVTVRYTYPGASPETLDAEVTRIIEGAVARVSGVEDIDSASEENSGRVRVEFSPGVQLEGAAADVREAVARITRQLPDTIEDVLVVKADDDAEAIVRIAAVAPQLSETELTEILETDIVPQLLAVQGVADVSLFGQRQRQLRVVVDPLRLASYGLSVQDVSAVLRQAQLDVPAGSFRASDQELLVRADASAVTEAQIEDLQLRDNVRIGDVAEVFFGPEDAMSFTRLDGRPVIGLGVVRQARSNTIQISDAVKTVVDRLDRRFDAIDLVIIDDNATFIRGAVAEVLTTLIVTVAIVVATLWLFLGSFRTTLIPSVAIPIALIGTVAAIWLLGFTINILTLLALVLATGLIVDDAIVVVENIQRRRAQGLKRRAAAVLGTRQVFFAVIATTAVLISVFVPISFLPSTAGKLFREFGFILAIAVAISSFVALSLIPSLVARLPDDAGAGGSVRTRIEAAGRWLTGKYSTLVGLSLSAPLLFLGLALALGLLAGGLYRSLDQELLPPEDRGVIFVMATGPDGVGLPYSERQAARIEAVLQPYVDSGEVVGLFTIVGRWDLHRAFVTAPLAPWDQRDRSQQDIMDEIRPQLSRLPGARASIFSSNSLSVGGRGGGLEVSVLGTDYDEIFQAAQALARAVEQRSDLLREPNIEYQPTQPQVSVIIDRKRAADLGIPLDGLAATLRAMIAGDELVDLNVDDQAVPIVLESAAGAINDPTDLANLSVRSQGGALVPLSSLVTLQEEGVAAQLDRRAQRRAVEMGFQLNKDIALAAAVEEIEALADQVLPPGTSLLLEGEAARLGETSRDVAITYAIALIVVFLVLVAQFESLTSATVVMVTVPFGIASAVFALWATGTSVNIYSQIGLVMLIGIMAKNGILLVEFADQLRDQGRRVKDAALEAAQVRLRPVAMTMMSTVLGGLPLILSSGPGAESRQAIGWVVFGGLAVAAFYTLFLTPVLYALIARFAKARVSEEQALIRELDAADPDAV